MLSKRSAYRNVDPIDLLDNTSFEGHKILLHKIAASFTILGVLLYLMISVFAMSLIAMSVILNSLTLRVSKIGGYKSKSLIRQ